MAGGRGQKRECPLSPGRLDELYWKEGKSIQGIREYIAALGEPKPSNSMVCRWMDAAGINRRTVGQGNSLFLQQNPQAKREFRRAGMKALNARIERGEHGRADFVKVQKKGSAAAVKARRERSTVTLTCNRCGKQFKRRRFRIDAQKAVGQTRFFCSRSCSAKEGGARMDVSVWLKDNCAFCGKLLTRPQSHFKYEKAYCSTACSNRGRARDKKERKNESDI